MLAFELFVLDAKFNSASNGVTFKGGHRTKMEGFAPNTGVFGPTKR